jgi:hypothetical protein
MCSPAAGSVCRRPSLGPARPSTSSVDDRSGPARPSTMTTRSPGDQIPCLHCCRRSTLMCVCTLPLGAGDVVDVLGFLWFVSSHAPFWAGRRAEQSPSTYPSCSDATHSFHELERSRRNSAGNRGRKKRATRGKSCIHDEMLGDDMPCLSAEGCAQYPCANSLHKHRAEVKPATGCLEMPHEAFRGFRGDILSILQGPLLCLEHSSRTRSILSQEHSSRTTAVPVAHAQGGALDAHTQEHSTRSILQGPGAFFKE